MNLRNKIFLTIGAVIRSLPRIRGKVRFGLFSYKMLDLRKEPFVINASLFEETLTFRLNLNCAHERMAYLMGQYESETSAFLTELFKGGSFLDVGANIGLITLPFVERTKGKTSSLKPYVYAVEALPINYRALCENIELNSFGTFVAPLNIGLGEREAEVFIEIEGNDSRATGTANIKPSDHNFTKIPLHIKSVDQMVEEGQLPADISLIKIDTDGYDYEVLKGARKLLAKNRCLVFAELSEHCMKWHGYGIKEVVRYLKTVDYETWQMTKKKPMKFKRYEGPNDYGETCLLVPLEITGKFKKYLL